LFKRAQNSFGVNNVTDEQEVGPDTQAYSAGAFLSIVDIMSRFQNGSAQLSKGELTLSGTILLASSIYWMKSLKRLLMMGSLLVQILMLRHRLKIRLNFNYVVMIVRSI
jgi:hypothetical protein